MVSTVRRKTSLKRRSQPIRLLMMLQLVFAYLFAAGTGVAMVYLARQNRKQGWERPAPKWFGVQLERHEAPMPATLRVESTPDELLHDLMRLNRELAAHGSPVTAEVASPELKSAESAELVGHRRA